MEEALTVLNQELNSVSQLPALVGIAGIDSQTIATYYNNYCFII